MKFSPHDIFFSSTLLTFITTSQELLATGSHGHQELLYLSTWPLGHSWTAGSHHSVYLLPLDLWTPRPPKNPHALSLSWLCVSLAILNPVIWLSSYAPPDTGTVLASTLWVFPASPHTHKIYLHALPQGTEHDWNQMHVPLPCSPIFQNLLCTTWLLL